MTGPQRHPVELIAQLDAAALGPIAAARARRQLAADSRTPAARGAISATHAELARLAAAPAPALPPDVSARCAAALAELPPPDTSPSAATPSAATPSVTAPAATPSRWRGRAAAMLATAVLAAAAALAGGVMVGLGWLHSADPPARSGVSPVPGDPARLALTRDTLASAIGDGLVQRDLGPLSDPGQLAACQRVAGLPAQPPLGGRQVLLDGRPGVLLVLPTGVAGRFRLVVVMPECGTSPASPVLADVVVGR